MKSHATRRQLIRCLAASVVALSALGTGSQAHAQAKLKLRLVLPTPATTYQLPFLIAKDTGWFAGRGLEVEEIFVNGDATALRMMLAGSADITVVGPPTVFQAVNEGARIKYIGSPQPLVDYQILGAKSITTLAGLGDKTFASAGPSDMTTEIPRLLLRKNNINTDGVKFLQVGGHAARLQALEAGKVQGAMVNTLTTVIAQRNGQVNVISNVAKEFPQLGYVMYTVQTAALGDPARFKALEIFMQGNIIGARTIVKDPEAAAQILSKRVPDLSKDLLVPVLKQLNASNVWGVDGGLDPAMVAFTSDALTAWKMIDKPVSAKEIIDDRVVKAALSSLPK